MVVIVTTCHYRGENISSNTVAAVSENNRAVACMARGDWALAERHWNDVETIWSRGDMGNGSLNLSTFTSPTQSRPNPPSLLDEGWDVLDVTARVINLQPLPEESDTDDFHDGDLSTAFLQTIICFNLAQRKYGSGDKYRAALYYQQALESMLCASDVTQLVRSSKISIRALWLIQNVGIPALYTLGRLAYQDRQWPIAASFLEIALTHASNQSMISACRVFDETKPLTSPTIAGLQMTGGILNALGVVHYRWSISCATESGDDASPLAQASLSHFYLAESLPLVREAWGDNSPVMATALNNLGRLWLHCSNYPNEFPSAPSSAVDHLERAVAIRQTKLDRNCLDTPVSLYNL